MKKKTKTLILKIRDEVIEFWVKHPTLVNDLNSQAQLSEKYEVSKASIRMWGREHTGEIKRFESPRLSKKVYARFRVWVLEQYRLHPKLMPSSLLGAYNNPLTGEVHPKTLFKWSRIVKAEIASGDPALVLSTLGALDEELDKHILEMHKSYGVDDIARMLGCTTDRVRACPGFDKNPEPPRGLRKSDRLEDIVARFESPQAVAAALLGAVLSTIQDQGATIQDQGATIRVCNATILERDATIIEMSRSQEAITEQNQKFQGTMSSLKNELEAITKKGIKFEHNINSCQSIAEVQNIIRRARERILK